MPHALQIPELLRPPGATTKRPSKRDRDIFLLSRRGHSTEQLAAIYHVNEVAIRSAIERYNIYRDGLANEEIDLDLNAMAVRLIPKAEKVLVGAMGATTTRTTTGKNGKAVTRTVPDHAMRLKGIETMRAMMETARPKGGGIQINTQVNNPGGHPPPERAVKFDFESRVRQAREAQGLANDDAPIDAEYEDEMMQNVDESADDFEDEDEDEDEDDEEGEEDDE